MPEKLCIAVHAGEFDRVHYALVMAAAAAAMDVKVTLFFTMQGCRALLREGRLAAENAETDNAFEDRGVARFEELFESCVELGVRFMVCEMGLAAAGIGADELRGDAPVEITGFVSFLADAGADGQIIFV
ncbi:MAG: DsrE/DsrF/DrsH-like family protein [Rhodospirillales bacterium]